MMRSCECGAGLKALGMAALLTWGAVASAEVVLETAVRKVETTLDAGGRVKRELIPVEDVVAGEELRYQITFTNTAAVPVDPERIVITNPIPEGTRYLSGSAGGDGSLVEYSSDGETFSATEPGAPAAAGSGGATAAAATTVDGVHSVRWTYQRELSPGDSAEVFFHVRMQ